MKLKSTFAKQNKGKRVTIAEPTSQRRSKNSPSSNTTEKRIISQDLEFLNIIKTLSSDAFRLCSEEFSLE